VHKLFWKGTIKRKQEIGWVLSEIYFQSWETNVMSKSLEDKANKQNKQKNINRQPFRLIDR
jgi:hypothetical protein